MNKRLQLLLVLTILLIGACAPSMGAPESPATGAAGETESTQTERQTLTVMGHDSVEVSETVVEQFEQRYNVDVQFLKAGDTGTALNQAILSKQNPLADVFYGVDNTFLSRALEERIFEAYPSPMLEVIPDRFELDPQYRALPVDYGDVCLNYDKAYFSELDLEPPQNLDDLTGAEYRGLLAVTNPATSSPGLAFLLATIGYFGEQDYLAYWEELVANDLLVVNDWETAYYGEFSAHGGTRPIVLSYGSSPPAEVYFAEEQPDEPPTGVVHEDGSCFRQIEFVGVLAGTEKPELARAWIDFMLSPAFQEDMPLNMFVFPVNPDASLPDVFEEHLVIPAETAAVAPETIEAQREAWIQAWNETVLQ
ncbi:MAG: thiamine ABC transporter substrate-binding protein [Anaerolineales bacterium]|nr:thiamine ABC transporter substrate-binding protein [Anaerolineales bacterium]